MTTTSGRPSRGVAATTREQLAKRESKPRRPRIYLAGKISENSWRHDVVKGKGVMKKDRFGTPYSVYACGPVLYPDDPVHFSQFISWPVLPRSVVGTFDYVGPYSFPSEAVENQHSSVPSYWKHGGDSIRDQVREQCFKAIEACDVFYAWIDDRTAYGTFVEVGYAQALKKRVVIDGPLVAEPSWDAPTDMWSGQYDDDLWFVTGNCWGHESLGQTPRASLEALARQWRREHPPLESEIEKMLWTSWLKMGAPHDLEVAYEVAAQGKQYRIDFAHLPTMTAVELDGYAYHSTKEAFIKDRERQRNLTAAGWTFVRYAGKEVTDDPDGCAKALAGILDARSIR